MEPYWFLRKGEFMATITLKNIPDELYKRLKQSAKANHRSLNSEIIYCAERFLTPQKIEVTEFIKKAREVRKLTAQHPMTKREIDKAKKEGRK